MTDSLSIPQTLIISKPENRFLVKLRIKEIKANNSSFTPYIDKRYYCGTCKSKTGRCHPITGYCFICDTDNWIETPGIIY